MPTKYLKRMEAYRLQGKRTIDCNKTVSVGRVYRLMKAMALPKMSTVKPKASHKKDGEENIKSFKNLLNKKFNPTSPNQVGIFKRGCPKGVTWIWSPKIKKNYKSKRRACDTPPRRAKKQPPPKLQKAVAIGPIAIQKRRTD